MFLFKKIEPLFFSPAAPMSGAAAGWPGSPVVHPQAEGRQDPGERRRRPASDLELFLRPRSGAQATGTEVSAGAGPGHRPNGAACSPGPPNGSWFWAGAIPATRNCPSPPRLAPTSLTGCWRGSGFIRPGRAASSFCPAARCSIRSRISDHVPGGPDHGGESAGISSWNPLPGTRRSRPACLNPWWAGKIFPGDFCLPSAPGHGHVPQTGDWSRWPHPWAIWSSSAHWSPDDLFPTSSGLQQHGNRPARVSGPGLGQAAGGNLGGTKPGA